MDVTDIILLATEATEEATAASGGSSLPLLILVVALAAFTLAYFLVGPGKRTKGDKPKRDVPLAMRPYHSDKELETTGLERAMSWGVVLALFSGVFLSVYWIIEPDRIENKIDEIYEEDTEFGRLQFANACVNCHGENGQGGFAPHPDPTIDAAWPAPQLNNLAARYADSPILKTMGLREFLIQTIHQGRAGTPMPAWGSAYGGAMNDQQIEAIADYVLAIQTGDLPEAQAFVGQSGEDLFSNNCARCHGQNAEGYVGPSLTGVFERYGADASDPVATAEAMKAIKHAIVNGRFVPGGASMPAWNDQLADDAINRIVEYLLAIQNPPVR